MRTNPLFRPGWGSADQRREGLLAAGLACISHGSASPVARRAGAGVACAPRFSVQAALSTDFDCSWVPELLEAIGMGTGAPSLEQVRSLVLERPIAPRLSLPLFELDEAAWQILQVIAAEHA